MQLLLSVHPDDLVVGDIQSKLEIPEISISRRFGCGTIRQDIGIPAPEFFGPFVGVVEIASGGLLIVGLLARLASIPLLIAILVAIATTKIPMLSKAGFWGTMHEARTDLCMLLGVIFLLIVGSGTLSFDDRLSRQTDRRVERAGVTG